MVALELNVVVTLDVAMVEELEVAALELVVTELELTATELELFEIVSITVKAPVRVSVDEPPTVVKVYV